MPRLDLRFANCELPFTPGVKWAATTSVGRVLAQHTARSPAVFRVLAVSASPHSALALHPASSAASSTVDAGTASAASSTAAATSEGWVSGCDSHAVACDRVDAPERVEETVSPAGSAEGLCAGAAAAL